MRTKRDVDFDLPWVGWFLPARTSTWQARARADDAATCRVRLLARLRNERASGTALLLPEGNAEGPKDTDPRVMRIVDGELERKPLAGVLGRNNAR